MRTLLIDADVVAYKAAASAEKAFEWEPGMWTWHADENEARRSVLDQIDHLMATLEAQAFKLCLTDSDGNFRKDVLPTYKSNRAGVKKPLVLKALRAWLIEEKGAYLRPRLEGDDCMGILATSKHQGDYIIVSIDKDMKSIPGLYYRDAEAGVVVVSAVDADLAHLTQTLTGDSTDGYAGCPGIGPKKAAAILQDAIDANAHLSGSTSNACWPAVVKAFEKAGLDEHEALVQARVARILRASDYDFNRKEPILWTPPTP